jgi:hypothetical protein
MLQLQNLACFRHPLKELVEDARKHHLRRKIISKLGNFLKSSDDLNDLHQQRSFREIIHQKFDFCRLLLAIKFESSFVFPTNFDNCKFKRQLLILVASQEFNWYYNLIQKWR